MSFDTLAFFAFFLVVIVAHRLRLVSAGWMLLAASIGYYLFAGWRDAALFAVVLGLNFWLSQHVRSSRAAFVGAVVFNVGVLAIFKYRGLFLESVGVAGSFEAGVLIPLGISFYVFQLIAYLTDVRRGDIKVETSADRFALFVGFFPQLVAGPIVRGHILLPQVRRLFEGTARLPRLVTLGLGLCLLGLVKKVGLSDSIAPTVDEIFRLGPADAATAWLGAWLFGFQIYFDFSGYSDMAVGMALLLGIRLPFNFRTPYLAASPREFWQRWHITLSTWIRDYLYVPLGGSRGDGRLRQAAVLIGVMGLAGFWHGANWTFVVWGLAWGVAIYCWRFGVVRSVLESRLIGWAATMLFVFTLWVFFRTSDIGSAASYIGTMWGAGASGGASYFGTWAVSALLTSGAIALLGLHKLESILQTRGVLLRLRKLRGPFINGLLVGLIAIIVLMPKGADNPFIYFRF